MRAIRLLRSPSGSGAMLLAAERSIPLVTGLDERGGAVDDFERRLVAGLVVVVPRAHAVMAEQHPFRLRVLRDQGLHQEPDVEARPLPGQVDHLVAVDLAAQALLIHRRRHRDHRVRVKVVDVPLRDEGVERRVDRARARVEVVDAMAVEGVHLILDCRLRAALGRFEVSALHGPDLLDMERGEPVALGGAQVAARALDPEHLDVVTAERVRLESFDEVFPPPVFVSVRSLPRAFERYTSRSIPRSLPASSSLQR